MAGELDISREAFHGLALLCRVRSHGLEGHADSQLEVLDLVDSPIPPAGDQPDDPISRSDQLVASKREAFPVVWESRGGCGAPGMDALGTGGVDPGGVGGGDGVVCRRVGSRPEPQTPRGDRSSGGAGIACSGKTG